jgi:hypothetical protein
MTTLSGRLNLRLLYVRTHDPVYLEKLLGKSLIAQFTGVVFYWRFVVEKRVINSIREFTSSLR